MSLTVEITAQEKAGVEKSLRSDWMKFENDKYTLLEEGATVRNTIYFKIETNRYPGSYLSIQSVRPFFVFFNGKLSGEYQGKAIFKTDSLAGVHYTTRFLVAVHQPDINTRDLKTAIIAPDEGSSKRYRLESEFRPATFFKDYVIISGLVIIFLFLIAMRINPKLASDYLSIIRIFSVREADDAQANARLTSSSNIQFYVICSLLLGFYMMIIIFHLPDEYALPLHFQGYSFWTIVWQWIRLSAMILGVFFVKILLIFSLTRLFGLKGLARIHFFNWVRLLLIVFGASSIILFVYFILRGQSPDFFIVFLTLVVGTLVSWIFIVFLKLNGKTEHSMFHLFSYICATEIIPLLITIKVLFQ